jgi:hypothetical protein
MNAPHAARLRAEADKIEGHVLHQDPLTPAYALALADTLRSMADQVAELEAPMALAAAVSARNALERMGIKLAREEV